MNSHAPFYSHLTPFMPPDRDNPPDSPSSWNSTLPRSSGSVSASVGAGEGMVTVGDAEVKLRKSKKKKKRSSMIFITEERERTQTLDCKRVRLVSGGEVAPGMRGQG